MPWRNSRPRQSPWYAEQHGRRVERGQALLPRPPRISDASRRRKQQRMREDWREALPSTDYWYYAAAQGG
ncbi:hypothetical protein NDU88_006519 [Pleurodeles waltl]|uniref:Uncharacterized protein n=1 Tax=Pleurodeles waltl TaxID=8319 RepID=A0AAV7PM27_PLEWA|nr:hypothetical protein NDU88_006519 [Pleurodeles waltl]